MQDTQYFKREIFNLGSEASENLILELFAFQATNVQVYKEWIDHLGINVSQVDSIHKIPFLPVRLFSTHDITDGNSSATTFKSSGTTGRGNSRHLVHDLQLYENSFLKGFEHFYGQAENFRFLVYLPAYDENPESSLMYMMDRLIKASSHPQSGFYMEQPNDLWEPSDTNTILFGVSFALLELARTHPQKLSNTIIMETGGMKGRGPEITREALHAEICDAFQVNKVHSEYGMSELLSQAYSSGNGLFDCPPWMRVLIRDLRDPFSYVGINDTGGINVIDLANIHSCAFIATDDLGRMQADGRFEVLGRFDHSELRGCNLMFEASGS